MAKQSAGIVLYRLKNNTPEFFLVHPGGPFWKNKDEGAWSIPKGEFSKSDIDNKDVNLLFFGNFYKMSLDDYTAGMQTVMADKDFLYATLIRDVYSQGVVLGKKYKLLRIAYNVFMFGLVLSILGFIGAVIIYK